MSLENIILNDNFKTKQISLTSLTNSLKNYQKPYDIPDKEVLTFDINDIQFITVTPGPKEYKVAGYSFNEDNPDPTLEINGSWSRKGSTVNTNNNAGISDIDNIKGVYISSTGNNGNIVYTKEINDAERQQFKYTTGRGYQEFKLAILDHNVTRESPFLFTPIISTDYDSLKSTNISNQYNYIECQVYDGNNLSDYLKYILYFKLNFLDDGTKNVIVQPHLVSTQYIIPNWDGQSLKDFKIEYSSNENNNSRATFYYKDNENNWVTLIENWAPVTSSVQFTTYGCSFGNYYNNRQAFSSIVMNYMSYSVYSELDAICTINDKIFDSFYYFIEYCQNLYSYNIGGSGNATIEWFFNNRFSDFLLTDSIVKFDENWFPPINYQDYYQFGKKYKNIKIVANKGSITSFLNPNKKIYNINLSDLKNLTDLDVSNNLLNSLDISQNLLLKNINVSDNKNLKTLILPKGNAFQLSSLNVNNTKIKNLELINSKSTLVEVNLQINALESLESLTIQGIKVSDPESFTNIQFPNIKEINISESNLLTNKNNLELFLNNLPDRTGKETGIIYLYGKKYISGGVQGSAKDIAQTLNNLKNKNWLFYL